MTRSRMLSGLSLGVLALAFPVLADDPSGKISCEILENAEAGSGDFSVMKDGVQVATGTCGKDLSVPAGKYDAVLRLDGALDSPEQTQAVTVKKNASTKLKADFETGLLEVRIASQGKRAAGMAIIKRDGKQIGTLGSGVPAHLSAGTYQVVARYRTQEKAWTDVKVVKAEHVTLDAALSEARTAAISGMMLGLLSALALCACGTHDAATEHADTRAALELTLAHADRSLFELAQLRGKPALLFLFATYDGNSQLALTYLERLLQHEKRLTTLGIALQPDAQEFLDPYRDALSVSFPLSYDPQGIVLRGETGLGPIASVPAFVSLDARGHVLGIRYGALTEPMLRDFIAPALEQ